MGSMWHPPPRAPKAVQPDAELAAGKGFWDDKCWCRQTGVNLSPWFCNLSRAKWGSWSICYGAKNLNRLHWLPQRFFLAEMRNVCPQLFLLNSGPADCLSRWAGSQGRLCDPKVWALGWTPVLHVSGEPLGTLIRTRVPALGSRVSPCPGGRRLAGPPEPAAAYRWEDGGQWTASCWRGQEEDSASEPGSPSAGLFSAGPYTQASSDVLASEKWTEACGLPGPPRGAKKTFYKVMPAYVFMYLFFISWPHCKVSRIFVPQPGIEPTPPVSEPQSPNHWGTPKTF